MLDIVLIIFLTFVFDLKFGDPRNNLHPTAWTGLVISKLVNISLCYKQNQKFLGVVLTIITVILILILLCIVIYLINFVSINYIDDYILHVLLALLSTTLLFKTTISIHGMEKHSLFVVHALNKNDYVDARKKLSLIVSRDTTKLDKNHIISAVLESIGENIVDGITAPLFYFILFGIHGAFVYRTINTIDSMIGYKTEPFKDLGWFGANCDTLLNYLPSRITAYIIVFCSIIFGYDWKNSMKVMKRDNVKTDSYNSGYTMSALAGALQIKLEKIDHYVIGDGTINLTVETIKHALRLMKITSAVFCILLLVSKFLLFYYFGWIFYV
ncbi:MAG: cobalamin biosynthesis protein [Thaumarchaeota archaeon]|nr:cobalamin biosynthesis protein [Nitrososphaerota archaeon]